MKHAANSHNVNMKPTKSLILKIQKSNQKGSVFLEFVLTTAILIPLVLATIEISHAISQYKMIVNQTRAAARYLMTQAPGDALQRTYAKCLLMTATLDCSGQYLLSGLRDPGMISILDSTDWNNSSNLKQVRTTDNLNNNASLVNLIEVKVTGYQHSLSLGWTNITFSPIRVIMRQIS